MTTDTPPVDIDGPRLIARALGIHLALLEDDLHDLPKDDIFQINDPEDFLDAVRAGIQAILAQRDRIAELEAQAIELDELNLDLAIEIKRAEPHLLDEAKIQLGWRCDGCGADYSLRELKARNPKSISCCPERNLLPQSLITDPIPANSYPKR